MKKVFIQSVIVLAFLALIGCSSGADAGESLIGPVWVAASLNGSTLLPTTTISAEFSEEGLVSGSSGCNNYSTSYTIDGDSINFGEAIASTQKFCPPPINEQERVYFQMLNEATSFEINNSEKLTLFDDDENVMAVYMAQSQALEGSSWDVTSYNNGRGGVTSLIAGTEITANFAEDGKMTGTSGCNNYTATYEIDGESISIGPPAATSQFCAEPEGIMEQEGEYLTALQTAASYKIEVNSMNMRTDGGSTVANFSRTTGQ